jgi:hypothetical protein
VKNEVLEIPEMFGFTTEKDIYKAFIDTRNMDIFYCNKTEITDKLYQEFITTYKARELQYLDVYTRSSIDPMKKEKITILSTWLELEGIVLKIDKVFEEMMRHSSPTVFRLKEKYIEALSTIYYLETCKFSYPHGFSDEIDSLFSGLYQSDDEKGVIKSNLDYDEFALYLYFNGYTFK